MFTDPPHSRRNSENAPKEDDCLDSEVKSKQPASKSDEDSGSLFEASWTNDHNQKSLVFCLFPFGKEQHDTHGLHKLKKRYDMIIHVPCISTHLSFFGRKSYQTHCKSKGLLANSQSHSRKGLKFCNEAIVFCKRWPFGVREIACSSFEGTSISLYTPASSILFSWIPAVAKGLLVWSSWRS